MTWDEFKALVEAELEQEGRDGSTEIYYMEFFGASGCTPWVTSSGEIMVE